MHPSRSRVHSRSVRPSWKLALAAISASAALWSPTVSAQTLGMYLSAPAQQDTTRTGATVERFLTAGAIGASGTWAIGDYTATSGNRAAASQYGGAGGTGQFLSVGAGTISVALTGNRQYVGFWWSAGDATNIIRFYDTDNNLLAEFTTASLVNLLQGPGNITALDGQQYAKADYFGNPNPNFLGMNNREPYGYVNLLLQGTSVRFGRIEIRGSNFELDNIAIADPVPVDTSWVDYGSQPVALPPGAVGASNDTSATRVDTPVSGNAAANDTAPTGSRWTKTTDPANGSVVMNDDGTYTYTPAPGFIGVDSFDYTVCKPAPDSDQCANATVRVTVGLDAVDDRASTRPNTPVNASVPNNDVFPSGATFTVSSSPTRGTVTMDPATGNYTYTPNANVTGTDTFQYRLCLPAPNTAQCDTATVTVTVNANTAPVASAVTITGAAQQDSPLTGTYTYGDAQNDAESASTFRWVRSTSGTSPAGGFTVGTGSSYTPTASDVGQFLHFCVTPQAQTGTTPGAEVCTATAAITVPPNTVPVASAVTVTGVPQQGVPLTGSYTYGDAQNDAESASTFRWVRSASGTSPAGGSTVGTGTTYTPTAADAGQFLFFCVTPQAQTGATPGEEACTATAAVAVPPNTVPVASAVTVTGVPQQGVPLTGSYTYGDAQNDAESASTFRWVRSTSATSATGGSTVGTANTYTPATADVGEFLFFCVTPQAQTGASPGAEVCTAASATPGGPATPVAARAAPTPIPTMSEWGMLLMSSLLALCAVATIRRRRG